MNVLKFYNKLCLKYTTLLTVSIIIPVLDEKENLEILIPLLHKMEGLDEIIVVEAAATKQGFMPDDDKVRVISSPYNHRARQMNQGAKTASGDILVFLHADVIPHPISFQKIRETIGKGYGFGFFSYTFEPSGILLAVNARFTKVDGIFAGGGDQIHFMQKDIFTMTGGYDEEGYIMEDFAFTRKVRRLKIPYCIIDVPATVSSRKYRHNSYIRVNFTNLVAMLLFYSGTNTRYIHQWCQYMLRK